VIGERVQVVRTIELLQRVQTVGRHVTTRAHAVGARNRA